VTLKSIDPAILMEGEIGDIGTDSEVREQGQSLSSSLTTPAEAK
jgi:fructose-bisphosphate aldolase class II